MHDSPSRKNSRFAALTLLVVTAGCGGLASTPDTAPKRKPNLSGKSPDELFQTIEVSTNSGS